jgi:predicted Zn-dependent protease
VRSHGCAARTGRLQPVLQLPNLTLKPGSRATSLEDLIKDVKRGYYVESGFPIPDQQLSNIQMGTNAAYEIVNGKLGAAAVDMALQFSLPRLWRGIGALGGPDAVWLGAIGVDMDDPDRLPRVGASAVPALVKAMNVVTLGREA